MDFSWNQLADPKFVFHDHHLAETVKEGDPEAQDFFRLLALCHTVMPEEKTEGEIPLRDIFYDCKGLKQKIDITYVLSLEMK